MTRQDRRFGYIGNPRKDLSYELQFIKDIKKIDNKVFERKLKNEWHPIYFSIKKKIKNRDRAIIYVEPNPNVKKGFYIFTNAERDYEMEVNNRLSYSKALGFVKKRLINFV